MGVGLYLVYPVFYTDITDAYRLGRGAKLRTSLGGFYFNLIFALAALGLYALTRAEFLLILMALIDLEIVYQMLPFVRMDGYWILADLTGIPDFFSQMGGFVRSMLGRDDANVPELKPWAKVVFAAYTIIVVPLIAFLLFLLFRSFPTVLATALDSSGKLAASAGEALPHGDGIAIAAAGVQIAILAVQVGGIGLVVFNVLKRVFLGLWRWGSGSKSKRVLSTAANLAVVAFLVYLWTPTLPNGQQGPLAAYTASSFTPLPETARGTIGDAVPAVDAIVPAELRNTVPLATPLPTGGPTTAPASAAPSATPSSLPSASSTPLPSGSP
jgi:putative peptide zinc metalloprotease protein